MILALLFKEYRSRTGRNLVGLVWALVSPMLMIGMLSLVWLFIGRSRFDGVSGPLFFAISYLTFLVVRRSISTVPNAIRSNGRLLDYPHVKPIDPLVARFIFENSLTLVSGCIFLFILSWFFGYTLPMPEPLRFAYVVIVTLTLGFGLSVLIGVYATLYSPVRRIVKICRRPLIIVSGVMHPIGDLPSRVREILCWNPLVQLIEYARHYALDTPLIPEADLFYPSFMAVILLAVGMIAYHANRYRLVQQS